MVSPLKLFEELMMYGELTEGKSMRTVGLIEY